MNSDASQQKAVASPEASQQKSSLILDASEQKSVGSLAEGKWDFEQGETLAKLRQLTEERQEKERNGTANPHSVECTFRPAGECVLSMPKEQQRANERDENPDDLAGRMLTPCPELVQLTGCEFDEIPSQKELEEKYRSNQASSRSAPVFVPKDNLSTVDSEEGFRIDIFTETIPPPPYAKNGALSSLNEALAATLSQAQLDSDSSCLHSNASGANTPLVDFDDNADDFFGSFLEQNGTGVQLTASEALAAILPHVESQSELQNGSRSSSRQPLAPYSQEIGAKSPLVRLDDRPDAKPVLANSSSSAGSEKFVSCLHRVWVRPNSSSPTRDESSASLSSDVDAAAESHQKTAHLLRILKQAGRSTASDAPPVTQITARPSVSAPAVNGYRGGTLRSATVGGSTVPVTTVGGSTVPVTTVGGSTVPVTTVGGSTVPVTTVGGSTVPVCPSRASLASNGVPLNGAAGRNSRSAVQSPAAGSTPHASGAGAATEAGGSSPGGVAAPPSRVLPATGKGLSALLGITLTPQERMMKFMKASNAKV